MIDITEYITEASNEQELTRNLTIKDSGKVRHVTTTRHIVVGYLDEIKKTVEKKNKLLSKKGADYSIKLEYDLKQIVKDSKGVGSLPVTISVDIPILGDWSLLGILDKARNTIAYGDDTILQNYVRKVENDKGSNMADNFICPVCGKSTRRIKSYIIKKNNADGKVKIGTTGRTFSMRKNEIAEVGSKCYKLLGGDAQKKDADAVLYVGEIDNQMSECEPDELIRRGTYDKFSYALDDVLDVAYDIIGTNGFVSTQEFGSTKDMLIKAFTSRDGQKYFSQNLKKMSKEIKKTIRDDYKGFDNFAFKIKQFANAEKGDKLYWVNPFIDFGVLAAMVRVYFGIVAKKREEKEQRSNSGDSAVVKYDGTAGSMVKDSIDVTLEHDVTHSWFSVNRWNSVEQFTIVMRDADNHLFVYCGSKLPDFLYNKDKDVYAKRGSTMTLKSFKFKMNKDTYWTHEDDKNIPHKIMNAQVLNIKLEPKNIKF